jgi:hypothetical protein
MEMYVMLASSQDAAHAITLSSNEALRGRTKIKTVMKKDF